MDSCVIYRYWRIADSISYAMKKLSKETKNHIIWWSLLFAYIFGMAALTGLNVLIIILVTIGTMWLISAVC